MEILRRPRTQCPHKKQCISKLCRDCKDGLGANEHFTEKAKLPKKVVVPLTPQAFHELYVHQRIHWLSMSYMNRCDPKGFIKSGLFQLRNYFGRIDPSKLQVFYDYISSLKEPTPVSIYDLYAKSEAHQLQLRLTANQPSETVKPYESLLDCLKGL